MKPQLHAATSALIAGVLYAVSRSWAMALSSFLCGVLLDLDHFVDYFMARGPRFDLMEFIDLSYTRGFRRVILFLHGWEWLAVLAVGAATDWNPWVVGLLVGAFHHLIFDQFTNGAKPLGYSLFWRALHAFDFEQTYYREEDDEKV